MSAHPIARIASVVASLALTAAVVAPASASAATRLGCGNQHDLAAKVKPRERFLGWPDLSLAESVWPRRIKWTSWGGPRATATARMRTKTYDPWTYVRVRASRRRRASATDFSNSRGPFYTRVRISFPSGYVHTWRTPVVIIGD